MGKNHVKDLTTVWKSMTSGDCLLAVKSQFGNTKQEDKNKQK